MYSKPNLSPLFQLAEKNLSPVILDQASSKKIELLHAFLPQLNMVNYEFRLTKEDSRVDANIMVWRYEAHILLDWLSTLKESIYQQLYKWVEDWINPKDSFHFMIQNIWLLYDLKVEDDKIPEPWLIFTFEDVYFDKDLYISLIKRTANYFENNFTDSHWLILDRMYSNLSKGQNIPAFGFQNRNINSIRLGVRDFFNANQMVSYLERILWPGDSTFIEQYFDEYIDEEKSAMISLTFNEDLLPALGIECYMDKNDNFGSSKKFLKNLVDQNLCEPEKSEAILNWIGYDIEKQPFFTVDVADRSNETSIKRWVQEIKLLIEPSKPIRAKVYFLINQIIKESE